MNEDIDLCIEMTTENMEETLSHLDREFKKLRAGKASTAMLDGISVDSYGVMSPLSQIANVSTPDARQIIVQPWDKSLLPAIEKEIINSNLGFNPQNNGEILRISVPALTEETRRDLVKKVKGFAETAKISIRNARRSANDEGKNMKKEGIPEDEIKRMEEDVQKITDGYSKKVDEAFAKKEKEIMTV